MAKGGYQKRRIQQKHDAEKAARRKARFRRQIMGWVMALAGLALVAIVLVMTLGKDEPDLLSDSDPFPASATPTASVPPSASPSPTPPPTTGDCTKPKDIEHGQHTFAAPPCMAIDTDSTFTATLKTNHGDITIELFDDVAPKTVNNFVVLSRKGFYDGLIFHRVIDEFMLQSGDPDGNGTGGPGYEFEDEFDPQVNFDKPGLLAMANSGPATNGSQFFITEVATTHLNQKHTIFGEVVEGMDVVHEIASVKTEADKPVTDVVIRSIVILER